MPELARMIQRDMEELLLVNALDYLDRHMESAERMMAEHDAELWAYRLETDSPQESEVHG